MCVCIRSRALRVRCSKYQLQKESPKESKKLRQVLSFDSLLFEKFFKELQALLR